MLTRAVAITVSSALLGLSPIAAATAQELEIVNTPASAGVQARTEEARATGEIVEIEGESFILKVGVFALRVDASALTEAALSAPPSSPRFAFEVGDRVEVVGAVTPGEYELSNVKARAVTPADTAEGSLS